MKLADFIEENLEKLLQDWDSMAVTIEPGATGLDAEELRDSALQILTAIAEDMRREQTRPESREKARGRRPANAPAINRGARRHAADRLGHGFTLGQLMAEYRALRASVVREWSAQLRDPGEAELRELTRFHEALDQSLLDATRAYHDSLEDARDLIQAVLAHDLRDPLDAISLLTETFAADPAMDEQHLERAERMRRSVSRIQSLVDDLLDFTRTRIGGGLPLHSEDLDLAALATELVEELRDSHPRARIELRTAGDLRGRWDRSRIAQLISNLAVNALEHGETGMPATISLHAEDEEEVCIRVHNHGGPIPQALQRVIFDPLMRMGTTEQGAQDRQRRHLGLGLYIARQVAEAHGGTLDLQSSEDAGTRFTARLPRRAKEGAATAGMTN